MKEFQQFYTDNKDRLFGYLLRRTGSVSQAADLVQESFTRYLEHYRKGQISQALLFTIGRNLFYDQVRRRKEFVDEGLGNCAATDDQETRYIANEQSKKILSALAQLTDMDRDILSLVVNSDLSYRQIGEMYDCSEQNIKVKVHRARKKLRSILEEQNDG